MRLAFTAAVLSLLSLSAMAQSAPPPGGFGAGGITRDQFVQRAAEAAGRRFDAIDTSHAGVITRAQIRAWHDAHQGSGVGQPPISQQ